MRRLLAVLCLSLTAVFATAVASFAQYADVRAEFLASNPNGGWEYGFIDEAGEFTAYNTTFDDGEGIAGWCLDNTPGPMGDATVNYTDEPIERYGVCWEPGRVVLHSPVSTVSVAVRWCSGEDVLVRVDASLYAQCSDGSVEFVLAADGQELVDAQLGGTDSTDEQPDVSAASRSRAGKSHSKIVALHKGSKIEFRLKSAEGSPSSHVSASFSVNKIGDGDFSSIFHRPQIAESSLHKLWGGESEFDVLVGRG